MRKGLAWITVILALALATPLRVFGDTSTSVTGAIVGRDTAGISRFTLRFSAPMVPLGQQSTPLAMSCAVPGQGRWIDTQTYVWEFARPLPAGLSCKAVLNDGLKDAAGANVGGTKRFPIDSGGPAVLAILPDAGGRGNDEEGGIEEDQAFLVAMNGPADRASIGAGAYCAVDGIGERIPVDLLPPQIVDQLLTATGRGWPTQSFLQAAGLPQPLPASVKLRAAALANVVALKCRRPLPPGRDMALIWGASIRSPSGHIVGEDHRFDFSVRKEFSARLTCARANTNAGCDPIEPIEILFSAPVARGDAMQVRLEVAPGRQLAPKRDDSDHSPTVSKMPKRVLRVSVNQRACVISEIEIDKFADSPQRANAGRRH